MYQNNTSRSGKRTPTRSYGTHSGSRSFGSSVSRPSFGGRSFGGSRRPSGNRGPKPQHLDINMFINKAIVVEEAEERFVPEHAFVDFAIDDRLKSNIVRKGYTVPTPIQDRTIPHILQGKDVVGIANTGTGKTAAFLVPLIQKVMTDISQTVLIVVPTRELALQIDQELKGFSPGLGIFSVVCVGGVGILPQIRALRHRNQFVIGTPGRLKDLIDRGVLNLSKTNSVVLDEADRMLDMGFINDMRYLMQRMPSERHTLFFSATLSPEIQKLVGEFLNNPVSISVKTRDTAKNVDQDIVRMKAGEDKIDALQALLNKEGFEKVLVFGRTKHGVQKLAYELAKRGFAADSIHGDKSNFQRQAALAKFKDGRVKILVATDVAARGLDIPNVSHVINFDIPATYDDYVHRIGRTGRGDMLGKALTFV